MAVMFDHQQNLFKSLTYSFRWSEDYDQWAEINHGVRSGGLEGLAAIDYSEKRATIFPAFGAGLPDPDIHHVDKLFDISKLEEFHR
jgi:hypothetical protein